MFPTDSLKQIFSSLRVQKPCADFREIEFGGCSHVSFTWGRSGRISMQAGLNVFAQHSFARFILCSAAYLLFFPSGFCLLLRSILFGSLECKN